MAILFFIGGKVDGELEISHVMTPIDASLIN